jgi:DNA-binding transcriptional LysR family regulator
VHIQAADSEEALNMVIDKQVELGIIGKLPLNKKLNAVPLWKDRLVLVAGRNHPWLKKKAITLPDLLKEPFVVREKGSATRELLAESLEKTHSIDLAKLNICAEMSSSEAVKEAIIAGLGVSVISVHAIARELSWKLLFTIPFSGCDIERDIYLIYLRQLELNLRHQLFIDFLKSFQSQQLR